MNIQLLCSRHRNYFPPVPVYFLFALLFFFYTPFLQRDVDNDSLFCWICTSCLWLTALTAGKVDICSISCSQVAATSGSHWSQKRELKPSLASLLWEVFGELHLKPTVLLRQRQLRCANSFQHSGTHSQVNTTQERGTATLQVETQACTGQQCRKLSHTFKSFSKVVRQNCESLGEKSNTFF